MYYNELRKLQLHDNGYLKLSQFAIIRLDILLVMSRCSSLIL